MLTRRLLIILNVMNALESLRASFPTDIENMGRVLRRKVLIICSGGNTKSYGEFAKYLRRGPDGSLPPLYHLVERALNIGVADLAWKARLEDFVEHIHWHKSNDADESKLGQERAERVESFHNAWLVIGTINTIANDFNKQYIAAHDFTRVVVIATPPHSRSCSR